MKEKLVSILTLFGSTGTLICCVLPATIATIAGGAALVSVLTAFPFLMTLSEYKNWIFAVAGILIALNAYLVYRPRAQTACDATGGAGCDITDTFNRRMLWVSITIYLVGVTVSFALAPLMEWIS